MDWLVYCVALPQWPRDHQGWSKLGSAGKDQYQMGLSTKED